MIGELINRMHNSCRWTAVLLIFTCMTLGLAGCGQSITLAELSATDQALAGPANTETPVPPNSSTLVAFELMATQTAQAQDILASQVAQAQSIQSTQTAQAQGILLAETSQAQAIQSTKTAQEKSNLLAETSQAHAIQSTQTAQAEGILLAETSQAQAIVNAQAIQSTQTAQEVSNLIAQTSQAQATENAQALAIQSTQTAQAEGILLAETSQAQATGNAQVLQTNQAAAAVTSLPVTATAYAATQAAGVVQEYNREQQAFLNRIVNPLIPFLVILLLVLFILLILLVYRRYMVLPWSRRPRFEPSDVDPGQPMMDGKVIVDPGSPPQPSSASEWTSDTPIEQPVENEVPVEIADPADPPFVQWIAEAEDKLKDDGKEP